jgi:probable rRNA maturation factor
VVTIDLEVQVATTAKTLPHPAQIKQWVSEALAEIEQDVELLIRIVDKEEIQQLNKRYRKKDKPTNVLSFPHNMIAEFDFMTLGDIILCAPVIEEEATQENKELLAHWAHMVVHGCLHLLGYMHDDQESAETMESLERKIMLKLGFPDPYSHQIFNKNNDREYDE